MLSLCLCCVFWGFAFAEAAGVIHASPYVFLCDLMWFFSRKGAKLAKAAGLLCLFFVFLGATLRKGCVCVISRFAFCSFCGEVCCVGFSQRRGGAEVIPILCLCCVFWGFAFADAAGVNSRFALCVLMWPYVVKTRSVRNIENWNQRCNSVLLVLIPESWFLVLFCFSFIIFAAWVTTTE